MQSVRLPFAARRTFLAALAAAASLALAPAAQAAPARGGDGLSHGLHGGS